MAFDHGHRICTAVRAPEASPYGDCAALPSRTRDARVQIEATSLRRMLVSIVVPAGGATHADVVGFNGASSRIPIGPGGSHLEIAVDLAQQFSRSYRPGVLRAPRALIAQTTATLPGVDGRKMSKSYGNAISLMAEPDDMRKQIRPIVTDSTPPAQPKDPDTCTLVALLRAFADPGTIAAVEERYRTGGIGYGEVKERLADAIDAHVAPMRNRYQRLLTDPAELDARLAKGEQHACQRADRTLARTLVAMGL